ncbi:MAG TPA: EAL domain-containing protein, partial [Pseudomonadales bacterium]
EGELHDALTKNTMELFYQPKVDLRSGKPTHAEALVRWTSPSSGPISPLIFVPIIEQIGRMEDLTKWAVNTALRQLKEWPSLWGDLSVAVNVCPSLVDDPELLSFVSNAITIWDVDPSRLTLEITEGSIIQDPESSFSNLSNIKNKGVKISIDDFGTGYSSLAYFKNIPANELKIDKSFVFHMLENEGDKHITHVISDLAHKFNLSVVAEGVETKEILYALIDAHCDYAQGFYFSKPLPQGQFIEWLNKYNAGKFF